MEKKEIHLIIGIFLIVIILGIIYYKLDNNKDIYKIEHIVSIKSEDKKIDAITGSFCYKEGLCIDKINFQNFSYDVITSYYDDKLYIDNLDGEIVSIKLFDYSIREFKDTLVNYTDDYIITPSISGRYIFIINATYQSKAIEYYFMVDINKNGGEAIDIKLELKENTLTENGLTMIIENLSDKDLEYGEPYFIEKYEDGFWKTLKPINEVSFILPAYSLKKNDSCALSINWEYGYGKLKGRYRIVKSFSYMDDDSYVSFNKYLEYEIK